MERFLAAAAEERRQRNVEHALERCAAHQVCRLLAAELEEGVAVDRGDPAFGIEREHAFARRSDQLGPAVEAHHEGVAEAMQEQALLDRLRRQVHQHQRVLLRAVGFPGCVEHRRELPCGIEYGRRAAGEAGVAREEVLVAMHDERRALGKAGPHAVGAAVALAPHAAGHQAGARGRVPEARIPVVGEQHAVAVGQDDRVARAGELAMKMRHLGVGEGQKLEALLLAREQLLVGHDRGLAARVGVEAVFVQTTQPRALHVLGRARVARRTASHGMHET